MMRVSAPKTWQQRLPAVKKSRSFRSQAPMELLGCWEWVVETVFTQRARWTAAPCAVPLGGRSQGPVWRTFSALTRKPTRALCGWARRMDGEPSHYCTSSFVKTFIDIKCHWNVLSFAAQYTAHTRTLYNNIYVSVSIHVYQSSDNIRNRKNSMKMQHSSSILCVL